MSMDIEARNAKIKAWLKLKAVQIAATEQERAARQTVTEMLFPKPVKGTQRYDLGGGYKVKLVYGTTYTLAAELKGNERVTAVEDLLEEIEALGNEGPAIAARIVKWTPDLSVTEYEKLDLDFPIQAKIKELIDAVLTTKPASPQLDFEAPK